MEENTMHVLNTLTPKMNVKTALLIISNTNHVGKILPSVRKHVNNTLYIQLISALQDPFGCFCPNVFTAWPKFSKTIGGIYSQATNHCGELDVRILLSGLKYKDLEYIQTKRPIDLIIFDKTHSENEISSFIKDRVKNIAKEYKILTAESGTIEQPLSETPGQCKVYKHAVLGGTFDRLHVAHKLLLTEAALRASEKITVGVTKENMLETKTLWELVEPIDKRIYAVNEFLEDINSELERNIVPIGDLYGPTKDDPTIDVIIVSAETERGGEKINEVRSSKGLKPLDIVAVELIDEPHPLPNEETKISSSTSRIRSLGTVLKPVIPNKLIPSKPYIIGLTGGIGSGKSAVAKRLDELGALVIDCDKVAHRLYVPGGRCHQLIVKEFGKSVLHENGEVNRKALGAIVFKEPKELQKLNSLIWPAIMEEVQQEIQQTSYKIVVVEAAILLRANWCKYCHEIWSTIVPQYEAVKRLQSRNGFTEEEAKSRIESQMSNKEYADAANVVICSLWPPEHTKKQIDKAWELLQLRISSLNEKQGKVNQ